MNLPYLLPNTSQTQMSFTQDKPCYHQLQLNAGIRPQVQLVHVLKCSSAVNQPMTFPCAQVDRKALPKLRMNHYTSLQSQAPSIMSQQSQRHSQVSIAWRRTWQHSPTVWLLSPLAEMDADLIMQWWLFLNTCSAAYILIDLWPKTNNFFLKRHH